MKMKTLKNILAIYLYISSMLYASEIDQSDILEAAQKFVTFESPFRNNTTFKVNAIESLRDEEGILIAWIAHLKPIGFLLLSTGPALNPILGYSHDSQFTGHLNTVEMIKKDIENRKRVIKINPLIQRQNELRWKDLLENGVCPKSISSPNDSIYYFPTPVWGQGYANGYATFNYYTPNFWSVGCVATAMAEVLAYYQWPPAGTGSHSYYEDDAGTISADYENTWYDWANMLFQYKGFLTNSIQRQAAGLLSMHAAISIEMDFESSGSTAETAHAPDAFHNYFRLSGHYSSVGSSGFWTAMENNMKDARPAILSIKTSSGFGHSVVADGFAESNGYYHLNMGWNGDDNGFYDISGSWNAGGYSIVVGAAKGLVPIPMILEQVEYLSENSFVLSWWVSPKLRASVYELQQATSSTGPWTTLSSSIPDSFYTVDVSQLSAYYFRVRAHRNDIWWDWSDIQKITMGGPRQVTFNVNMQYQTLGVNDSLVVRGNIEPLMGSQNSPAFTDIDGDEVYSLTLPFDFDYVSHVLSYRFAIARSGGTQMESFNRTHTIGLDEFQNLDTVYFDNYVSIKEKSDNPPKSILLHQNYPNPFNPVTNIEYEIPVRTSVELSIFNTVGQKVCTIVDEIQQAGKYSIQVKSDGLVSGVYFYRLKTDSKSQIQKMILMR